VLVENVGLKIAFWNGALFFFLGFLISLKFEHGKAAKNGNASRRQIGQVLKNPHWLIFLVLSFSAGAAFAASNTYFFPFMKELGATEGTMGLALTIGTLAEIPVMLLVNRMIGRFKSYGLFVFGLGVTGLRLLLFAISFNSTMVLFVQILNGLSFPVLWVAGVSYADEHAPEGLRTTAQGLFSAAVWGIGSATGGFLGGLLLANLGGRVLFAIFGGAVFVVLLLVTLIRARIPSEDILSPTMEY
jgi:PPP family 3-phenylpropionic acid transporter